MKNILNNSLLLISLTVLLSCSKQVFGQSEKLKNSIPVVNAKSKVIWNKQICINDPDPEYPDNICANYCYNNKYVITETGIEWLDKELNGNKQVVFDEKEEIEEIENSVGISEKGKIKINDYIGDESEEVWVSHLNKTTFIHQRNKFVTFKQFTYIHFCGLLHGMPHNTIRVFDLEKQKEIKLKDILISGKEKELANVLLEAYQQEAFEDKIPQSWVDYLKEGENWEKSITDEEIINFSFEAYGIKFQYNPYEISPYAEGMPEFIVPYRKLKNIIKDEYLE